MSRIPKSRALAVSIIALTVALGTAEGAAAKSLRATLGGAAEVPEKGDADGRGTARLTTNAAEGEVCYRITLSKVGSVAMGHIHQGAKGAAGAVVVPLFDEPTTRPRGCATGVKRSLIRAIERRPARYYVNVHNADYPAGAVRGQLR